MKHTQRLLAVLLTLVLAFGIGAPAMAEEIVLEEIVFEAEASMEIPVEIAEAPMEAAAVNWDDFYIITQPPKNLYVKRGESFTLSVEVNIPEGVEVTYQWYAYETPSDRPIAGATAPSLQLGPGEAYYPNMWGAAGSRYGYYTFGITATDNVSGQTKKLSIWPVAVSVEGTFFEKLYSVTFEPLVFGFSRMGDYFGFGGPFALLFGLPYDVIQRYINSFKGLFKF